MTSREAYTWNIVWNVDASTQIICVNDKYLLKFEVCFNVM